MNFNHWDIILFLPLLYAAWKGFRKGFIIEIASIIGLIAGVYMAANFSDFASERLKGWLDLEGTWLDYAAFITTFIAVVFGVYALAKVVEKAVNLAALKLVNKLAGVLFGTLKMALILSVVLNLLTWLDMHLPVLSKSNPEESLLFEPIQGVATTLLPVLLETEWMQKAEDYFVPEIES